MATDLMNAHPDLTGLVGECTSSAPGVAQAVQDANKIGKVFTVGLGTPQSMKPYLDNGSSSSAILWDVENLGYLTAWTGAQLAEGKPFAASNNVSSALPAVQYDKTTKTLLLGPPLAITKSNVDQYKY
jgi:rhamnose transport system substrate-binding protein